MISLSEFDLQTRPGLNLPAYGRMIGHYQGGRRLNGGAEGMSELRRIFGDEMACLNGELLLLRAASDAGEKRELEAAVWDHIAGLHTVFGQADDLDDLMVLLLVTREARLEGDLPDLPVAELEEATRRMADEPHTPALRLELSRKLRKAGVDLKRGF